MFSASETSARKALSGTGIRESASLRAIPIPATVQARSALPHRRKTTAANAKRASSRQAGTGVKTRAAGIRVQAFRIQTRPAPLSMPAAIPADAMTDFSGTVQPA